MGKKTGPGYWRSAGEKIELLDRDPAQLPPPFRPGLGWGALWLFIWALGGLTVWISVNAWNAGEPVGGRFNQQVPAWFALAVGLFLLGFPFWHLPQLRKENTRLSAIITATSSGLDVLGKTDQYARYFLPWETIRGFRVEKGQWRQRRKHLLIADLARPRSDAEPKPKGGRAGWNPLVSVTTDAVKVTDIWCTEPHATAHALNHLLDDGVLRSELGSPHSATAANNAQTAGALREARRQPR